MRHRYPLHVHISTLFLALILLICGVLTAIGYKLSAELLEAAAADRTTRISREAQIEMQRIIEPAEVATTLLALHRLTQAQSLEQRLNSLAFMRRALDGSPALSSLYVGYANGDFFLVGHIGHGGENEAARVPTGARYIVQSIERAGGKPRGSFIYLDAALQTLRKDDRPDYAATYDPRRRVWFSRAMASSALIKTPPYLFFSSRRVGITLASRASVGQAVVGADILLHSLGQTLARQKATPGNQLVIVDADGYALAYENVASLVRPSATADGNPSLARLDELGVPALIPLLGEVRKMAEKPLAPEPRTLRVNVGGT
ncbi:MAG: cache domain-containing protein, partial [Candidatus Accumulibacter sp.]|nr:cache domain-containing protein [Accumulibacter sp.]